MIGGDLQEIHAHIESLACEGGAYYLVCARYGDRPVPATGLRFDSRTTARAAARATEQYRTALRRYDPQLPFYDVIVCQDATVAGGEGSEGAAESHVATEDRAVPDPVPDPGVPDHQSLVEFCHRVAAATFETLSDHGHEAVESAVMDAYFDLAERLSDPDHLCLALVESMAREVEAHLPPAEQAAILRDAATRLPAVDPADDPIGAALSTLVDRGLAATATHSPRSDDDAAGARTVVVRLSEYALSPHEDRLPVLPLVLELHRRQRDWRPGTLEAVPTEEGWQVRLVQSTGREPAGLATAPIGRDA